MLGSKVFSYVALAASGLLFQQPAAGNVINDYLSDKTFGAVPGPCPTFNEKCTGDFENLPESVKDIRVCVFGGVCSRIGDLVKGGYAEIWDLSCKKINIGDIILAKSLDQQTQINADVDLKQFKLSCSFMTNLYDIIIALGDNDEVSTDSESLRLKLNLRNTRINFPVDSTAGTVDASLLLQFTTDTSVSPAETFATDLPNELRIPADECSIGVGLGIDLRYEQLSVQLGTKLFGRWTYTFNLMAILFNLNISGVVSVVIRLLEAIIGGIICQFISELAILAPTSVHPNERPGVLNEVLTLVKDTIDGYANTAAIDPEPLDADSEILKTGISSDLLQKATNFADSTVTELLSVGLNGWLGATSKTPGYTDKLVVNELVDQVTQPDGVVLVDLVQLELAPQVTVPVKVAEVTGRINSLAFHGLNTFKTFEILQNGYDSQAVVDRLRYTFKNHLVIDKIGFEVELFIKLAPGEWVTSGVREEQFSFKFTIDLLQVDVDLAARLLFNFEELSNVKIGQITSLADKLDPDQSLDEISSFLTDALQCFAPAIYQLNFTDMEISLGKLGEAAVSGGVTSELVESAVAFGSSLLRGALSSKLRGISRGIVRTTLNDLLVEYVSGPGRSGTEKCPAWVPPRVNEKYTIDFSSGIFASVYKLINDSVGGNPITDSGTDINELVDVILTYFEEKSPAFPLMKIPNTAQGNWQLADAYKDYGRLAAYQRPNDFVFIKGFQINHLNSIYKLAASQVDAKNGGIQINLGIGGRMAGLPIPGPTPLTLRLPFQVKVDARPADDVLAITEQFTFVIGLENIDVVFALTEVVLASTFAKKLYLTQIQDISCAISILDKITFGKEYRQLTVGNFLFDVERTEVSSNANKLNTALEVLDAELATQPEYKRFETLLNTILSNTLSLGLDLLESLPKQISTGNGTLTPENCSLAEDPLALLTELTATLQNLNIGEYIEECTAPVDFDSLPSVSQYEDLVEYDESKGDKVFDIQQSALVKVVSGLIDQTLQDGGLDVILQRLANSSGTLVADLFQFNPEDPNKVDLNIPLSVLGLRFSNDTIIPGLVVDLGMFTIKGVNKVLNDVKLLEPVGTFTTRNTVRFDKSSVLDVSIGAYVEMDRSAVDGPEATGKVRELIDVNFTMTDFTFEIDLVTAFNTSAFGEKTLNHFVTIDEEQTIYLSDNALDCWLSTYFMNGFSIRKLQVDVGKISEVSVSSRTNEILSESMESLFVAIADIIVDFYKDALTSIAQNCIRDRANAVILEYQKAASCPKKVAPPKLKGENAILRFDSQKDYQLVQDLLRQFTSDDDYQNLNAILKDVLGPSIFLNKEKGEELAIDNLPVIYYKTNYGTVDLGLSNVRIENLGFSNLKLGEPYKYEESSSSSRLLAESPTDKNGVIAEEAPYVILTQLAMPGPFSLQFDLVFNADGLFEEIPTMRNNLRVKLTLSDFDFGLLLLAKINLTDAVMLEFGAFSSLDQLPCLLIPLEALKPIAFNFSIGGLTAEVDCIDECNFPFFAQLQDSGLSFSSTNGEQIGSLLNQLVNWATGYLDQIGAQKLVDLQLANAEDTCSEIVNSIGGLFQDLEEPSDVASTMGIAFGATAVALFGAFSCIYPVHKVRRKQILFSNLEASEKQISAYGGQQDEMSKILAATELRMKSIFQHPRTPPVAKFLIPLLSLLNIGLVVIAVTLSGVISLTIRLTILGAESVLWKVVPITVGSLVNTLWAEMGWLVGLIIALACVVFPVLQNMILIALWFTPNTVMSAKHKASVIFGLEISGKVGFVLVFVISTTVAALYTTFVAADYQYLDFVPDNVIAFELNVAPERGMIMLGLIACVTLVLSHTLKYFFLRTTNNNKKHEDEIQGYRSDNGPSMVLLAKRRLADHEFIGRDRNGRQRKVRKVAAFAIAGGAALALVLICVGLVVPVITFHVKGVLGLLLQEISTDSPTLQQPLETRPFSVLGIGASLSKTPMYSPGNAIGTILVQIVFFLVFVLAPILQLVSLIAVMVVPMRLRAARIFMWFEWICVYWNGVELAAVVLPVMIFVISPLVRVYVNFISSVLITQNFCNDIEGALTLAVSNPEDAYCMDTTASIEPGYAFLALGVALYVTVTYLFSVVAGAALSDRYYAAYFATRSDAKPKLLNRLSVKILNICTETSGSVSDESMPRDSNSQLAQSIFNQDALRTDAGPGFCSAFCSYYKGSHSSSDIENRMEAWREKFEVGSHSSKKRTSDNPLFQSVRTTATNPASDNLPRSSYGSRVRAGSVEV